MKREVAKTDGFKEWFKKKKRNMVKEWNKENKKHNLIIVKRSFFIFLLVWFLATLGFFVFVIFMRG